MIHDRLSTGHGRPSLRFESRPIYIYIYYMYTDATTEMPEPKYSEKQESCVPLVRSVLWFGVLPPTI